MTVSAVRRGLWRGRVALSKWQSTAARPRKRLEPRKAKNNVQTTRPCLGRCGRWRVAAARGRAAVEARARARRASRATNSAAGIIDIPPRRWTRRVTRFRSVRVAAWSSSRRWYGRRFQGAAHRYARAAADRVMSLVRLKSDTAVTVTGKCGKRSVEVAPLTSQG